MADTLEGRSLLAVFAHPDDESITCGGVLAACAREGMTVTLVCATRGEGGSDHGGASHESLSVRRVRELAAAADVLGIETVTVLDFEDGMLPWVDGDELEDAVAAQIEHRTPDVVITFDIDGLYWHPDHIAVHEATTAAVLKCAANAPALYYATAPVGAMRALVDAVAPRLPADAAAGILGVLDVDAFGAEAPAPTIVARVSSVAHQKLAALQCHASQSAGSALSVLTVEDAQAHLGVEHLRRAPIGNATSGYLETLFQPSGT